MEQFWIDEESGLYINTEHQMKDLVQNKIIKSFSPLTKKEFTKLLTKRVDNVRLALLELKQQHH
jgi:hypothetical protein